MASIHQALKKVKPNAKISLSPNSQAVEVTINIYSPLTAVIKIMADY